jgi:hypothetical protein
VHNDPFSQHHTCGYKIDTEAGGGTARDMFMSVVMSSMNDTMIESMTLRHSVTVLTDHSLH